VDRIHGVAKARYTVAFFVVARALISSRLRWLQRDRESREADRTAERDRLLVRLYRFAWDFVPYYRRLYESSGLSRGDVAGLEDLRRLPLVSKAMLKTAPLRELRPARWRVPVMMKMTTSGSSGIPFARPDGKDVSVTVLGSAHADLEGVERFQYVQADPSALVLRYVAAPDADHAAIARKAEAGVRRHPGTAIRFCCQPVERIERNAATLKLPMLVRY
jgi:hypothetical protein